MNTQVADALLGSLIGGRYRVRSRVAQGGMATVYTATDERLQRTIALKIVHPSQATEPDFVDRFAHEARAVARLAHPNVVAVYDQGSHEGLPYLVMEYVNGRTLRNILSDRGRLTPTEALAITEQICAALSAAHKAGLVHRDIKPENVLVAAPPSSDSGDLVDSVVKVADFGLAQAVEASSKRSASDTVMATVAYVPPELISEQRADPRSDVYSTGIVLFEMLTGQVPFDGADASRVAWQHVEQDVPAPSTYAPDLPAALDELVSWATRRDPSRRPIDAGALLAQVHAARDRVKSTAPASSPPPAAETMVIPAVPAAGPSTAERPAWARLPSPRTGNRSRRAERPAGAGRRSDSLIQPPSPPTRKGPDRPITMGSRRHALAAAAVVFGLLVAVGGWWFGIGRWTTVPSLVGLAQEQAVSQAQRQGLGVEFAEPQYDVSVPADHVLAQDPGDRVRKGGTITLTLSLGPAVHPMPDVIGAQFDVTVRQLAELGLEVERGDDLFSDTVPEGRIVTVSPEVGEEVTAGGTVTVAVSRGRSPLRVPLLIGKSDQEARAELQQLGLVAAVERVQDDRPADEVIGQSPDYDTGIAAGDTVTIQVSEGPPTRPVPDVINQRCRAAVAQMEEAGFQVNLASGNRGRARFQNPSAGTGLPPGSQVTLWCL